MPDKSAADLLSIQQLEENRRTLSRVRVLFWILLPILLAAAVLESFVWMKSIRRKPEPLAPSIDDLKKPLPEIPALVLSSALFEIKKTAVPVKPPVETAPMQVATEQVQWKLRGVIMAGNKRASLEDPKTQQTVWVSEGDRVGNFVVKKIDSNAVLLELEGKDYEIRI